MTGSSPTGTGGERPEATSKKMLEIRRFTVNVDGASFTYRVFRDAAHARDHVTRHFRDPDEGWSAVLARTGRSCQISEMDDVSAYEAYADIIEAAVRYGAKRPLHLHTAYTPPAARKAHDTQVFLSVTGVEVVVYGRVVRTCMRFAPGVSVVDFWKARRKTLQRAQRGRYLEKRSGSLAKTQLRLRCTPSTWSWNRWKPQLWKQELLAATQGTQP